VRRGRKVVFCEGEVRCEDVLIARGSMTKMVIGGEGKKGSKL